MTARGWSRCLRFVIEDAVFRLLKLRVDATLHLEDKTARAPLPCGISTEAVREILARDERHSILLASS